VSEPRRATVATVSSQTSGGLMLALTAYANGLAVLRIAIIVRT
jgi:hypothetical protein